MTKVEGRFTHIYKWLAYDRVVFAIVSATIIGVLVETGIIRISGFVGVRDLSLEIAIFVGLGIFCVFSQLVILNYTRNKVGKPFLSHSSTHIGIINKTVVIIQLGIIALLIVVLLEVSLTSSYHTILIKAIVVGSFFTASGLMILLSWKFVVWIK